MNYGGEYLSIGTGRSMVYGLKEEVWATLGRGTEAKALVSGSITQRPRRG